MCPAARCERAMGVGLNTGEVRFRISNPAKSIRDGQMRERADGLCASFAISGLLLPVSVNVHGEQLQQ